MRPEAGPSNDAGNDMTRMSSLTMGELTWTGEEVVDLVARAAEGLHRLGVGGGSHVALLMRNCLELIVIEKALRWLGACPVPVNWHASSDESAYIIANCGATLLVAHEDLVPLVLDEIETIVIVPGNQPTTTRSVADDSGPRAVGWQELTSWGSRGPAGLASVESIIYTSGTTGRPKGVLRQPATVSQRRAGATMREVLYGLHRRARLLVTAPLYHAAPLQMASRMAEMGELVVVAERFDPESFLREIERHRVTHTFAVPTMLNRLLALPESIWRRYDISSLEFILHAGAPCPPSVKERAIEWFGPILFEYYGSTELGPVTFCSSSDWLSHRGTVGKPLPGVELAFLDPNGRSGALQPAEIGIRNESYPDFTYVGDADSRAALQRGSYIATGDVGYLDEDGYLYVCDRVGDMIISGGVNIYPAEIEAVILELAGVQDCAVFAISDEDLGEAVGAVVQPVGDGSISADEVHSYLEARLGRLKRPRHIELRALLPRSEAGKVKKRDLRAEFEHSSPNAAGSDERM